MNSPVNRIIDLVQNNQAAGTKNMYKSKKTLEEKVLEIVASANKMAMPERHVVPRSALAVMERAIEELSSLSDESREAGVLREVNKFISLNQNTFRANDAYAKHTDLLLAGHPLSDNNSSLSAEEYLQRYAAWLSADPGISDDVRHLVAAAYSQLPGSFEREHAFIRLNAVKASSLPSYFKIDIPALVAAFSFGDGNSSAARRARVRLQWRDRLGRWVEMGRGINFKFRLPDGGVVTAAGTYVGSDANAGYTGNWATKEANNGLVEVKGISEIPDGIYSIRNNNAESFKARLSEADLERAGVEAEKSSRYRLSSQFDESIPDLDDLLATKVDAPSGWTKNEDGSFTSDDDYKVIKKDDGYEVYRLDPDGNTGDKVGDARTWADAQNVAEADEEDYDKYKEDVESGQLPLGDGQRPEPRYSRMNRAVQQEIKQLKDQIPQHEESNNRIEDQFERALSGKDSKGRDLPEGWYSKIDSTQISEVYYKDIPGATRSDEYIVAIVGNDGVISYGSGGFWFNSAKPATTWEQITEDTPKIIDQINQGRATIRLDPIGLEETISVSDNISSDDDEPPLGDGGSRPKSPAPSSPVAPALFREFDVPAGAFELRTISYEPEGRVDEKSSNYTDDPNKLATRFPLDVLIRSFTQALIGNVDENVLDDIVDINDDGDGNIPDLTEVQDALEQRAPQADISRASGAGSLEFNAGDEFVQAEALYNAVWLAGGDPNRVIANAYDVANGNRSNLTKLINAQGGIPSPDDEKLIDDIQGEIKQIDDATADNEETIANADVNKQDDDMEFPGGLIENVPVDFKNPDYYNMDLSPYISTFLEPDDLGYVDNPKYIALMVQSADLIQQMQLGITNGTGSSLIRFNDDSTSEIPVEAIRDALQYQGVNTNDILFRIRDEEPAQVAPTPTAEESPAPEAPEAAPEPILNYPGPRQPGYTAANTTLDINGNVIASGARVSATKDGKTGVVVRIQNDPEYVRIIFDDGKTAVRSATKVQVVSNPDGSNPVKAPADLTPSAAVPSPSTDVSERLDRPTAVAPRIARAGDTVGVNDIDSKIPDELKDLTQTDVPQSKFAAWGSRDAEIAKAANTRVSLEALEAAMREVAASKQGVIDRDRVKKADAKLKEIVTDLYGGREGISFGAEYYTLKYSIANAYSFGTPEDIIAGNKGVDMEVSFDVVDLNGVPVGVVRRTLSIRAKDNADGTKTKEVSVGNSYMKVTGKNKKKGFASAYNRYMENWYIANGIEKVNVFAAGGREYQGGFVWALNGFGWSPGNQSEIKDAVSKVSRNARTASEKAVANRLSKKLSDAYDNETRRYDLSKAPTPMELALVGWYPGATDWLGKRVMTQTSWHGVKNLNPAAKEQVQAANYNQIKNAERRIQAGQNKPNVSAATLAYMSTNEVQTSYPELTPHLEQIRAALRNNDSLAKLSPDAKVALSKFTSMEMINKDSKISVEDTIKLRNALTAEYRADYAYSDPFEVGSELLQFTLDDFENDSAKIENAGYSYRELLRGSESGMNHTWEVTHVASGQVFYVKNEKLSRDWNNERGVAVETEMSILMNAMGMNGRYEVRASEVEDDFIVMSRAGANLPLSLEPINASSMLQYGLPSPDGERYYGDDAKTFVKNLKNPEDLLRMSILDMLGNNKDRHDGNWMIAFDTTDNKLVIFPIDNALSSISESNDDAQQQMYNFLATEWSEDIGDVYRNNMPGLIALAGKDRVYSIYANEVKKIIDNIDNELVKPRGNELAALIDKWGTYDAFKDAMRTRLENLITDGTELNKELRLSLGLGYWR
jgi:hypothetical protein